MANKGQEMIKKIDNIINELTDMKNNIRKNHNIISVEDISQTLSDRYMLPRSEVQECLDKCHFVAILNNNAEITENCSYDTILNLAYDIYMTPNEN